MVPHTPLIIIILAPPPLQAVLWERAGLPADALALVAVPGRPAALLITPVALLLCQQARVL